MNPMNAGPNVCPAEERLTAWLANEAAPDEDAAIGRHVEECESCQARVEEQLDWGDLEVLRQHSRRSSTLSFKVAPQDTALIKKLEKIDQPGRQEVPAGICTSLDEHRGGTATVGLAEDVLNFPDRIGKYELGAVIGRGGMGVVYLGFDPDLGRECAVKVLTPSRLDDEQAIARGRREMKAVGRLNHPNVVSVANAGVLEDDRPWIVMEYLRGTDLESLVRSEGRMAPHEAVQAVIDAARGLQHAHKKQLIHRDVKPSNLFLTDQGTVKVLDFGMAHLAHEELQSGNGLTRTGYIMGTVDFMSPEQASDIRTADQRSDIYSLGCTFAWLISGRRVFPGETVTQVLFAHRENPIPSLTEFRTGLPSELDDIFHRMLAKDTHDRFQSMEEVIEALLPWSEEEACMEAALPPSGGSENGLTVMSTPADSERLAPTTLLNGSGARRPRKGLLTLGALGGTVLLGLIVVLIKHGDKWIEVSGEEVSVKVHDKKPEANPNQHVFDASAPPDSPTATGQLAGPARRNATPLSTPGEEITPTPLPAPSIITPAGVIDTRPELEGEVSEEAQVSALQFLPDKEQVLVAVNDTVETWDISTVGNPVKIQEVRVSDSAVKALRLLPDQTGFVTGSEDGVVRVFQEGSRKPDIELSTERLNGVHSLVVQPDGRGLISGYWGYAAHPKGYLLKWDLTKRTSSNAIAVDAAVARCVELVPAKKNVVVCGESNRIAILEIDSPTERYSAPVPAAVLGLALSPDGEFLATVGKDHVLRIWKVGDLDSDTPLRHLRSIYFGSPLLSCQYFRSADILFVGGLGHVIALDTRNDRVTVNVKIDAVVDSLEISPDGRFLSAFAGFLRGRGNGRVTVWKTSELTPDE